MGVQIVTVDLSVGQLVPMCDILDQSMQYFCKGSVHLVSAYVNMRHMNIRSRASNAKDL